MGVVLNRIIVFNSTFRWICFGRHLLWFISEPLQLIKRLSLHGVTAKLLLYNNNFDLVDWSCVLNLGFVWESNIMCGFESRTTYVCPWRWFFFERESLETLFWGNNYILVIAFTDYFHTKQHCLITKVCLKAVDTIGNYLK